MAHFKKALVTTSLLISAGMPTLALQQNETALEYQRRIYEQHTIDNFDDGGDVSHYVWKNFPAFYNHATIARTNPERTLNVAKRSDVANFTVALDGKTTTLDAYVQTTPQVDGVIVLHNGTIVYEAYPNMKPYDRHIGWSVTKVFISTALAALEHQGRVDALKPIETYVPSLASSAWAGIKVRDIINMASGINCRDADGYQNTGTCIYRYEETLGLTAPHNPPTTATAHLRSMTRHREANTRYEYASPNTYVSSLLIENVTGKPLAKALQELIWNKIGAEADGLMMVNNKGEALAHSGLSARLRDIARFGQIFTAPKALSVVGNNHIDDLISSNGIEFEDDQLARHKRNFGADVPTHAAWQWDMIWPDGGAFKGGYSGQGIYIDPKRDLVIAFYGTADENGGSHALTRIARKLARSGLFNR